MARMFVYLKPSLLVVLATTLPIFLGCLLSSAQRPSCEDYFAGGSDCLYQCEQHTRACIRKVVYGAAAELSAIAEGFKESVSEYRRLRRLSPVKEQQAADDDTSEDPVTEDGEQPPASPKVSIEQDAPSVEEKPAVTEEGSVIAVDQDTPEEPAEIAGDEPAATVSDIAEPAPESAEPAIKVAGQDTRSDDSEAAVAAEPSVDQQDTPEETPETVDTVIEVRPAEPKQLDTDTEVEQVNPKRAEPVKDAPEDEIADADNVVEVEAKEAPAAEMPAEETADPVKDVPASTNSEDSSEVDQVPEVSPEDLDTGVAIFQVLSTPGYAAYASSIKEAREKKVDARANGIEDAASDDVDDEQFVDFSGIVDRVKQCVADRIVAKNPECVDQRLRNPDLSRNEVDDEDDEQAEDEDNQHHTEVEDEADELDEVKGEGNEQAPEEQPLTAIDAPTSEENVEQAPFAVETPTSEQDEQPASVTESCEAASATESCKATQTIAVGDAADAFDEVEYAFDENTGEEAVISAEDYAALYTPMKLVQQRDVMQLDQQNNGIPVELSAAEALEVDAYIAELMDLEISDENGIEYAAYPANFWAGDAVQQANDREHMADMTVPAEQFNDGFDSMVY